MSCPKSYELLDFVANVLPLEDKNALKTHFQSCSVCRQRLNHIQPLQSALYHHFEASDQSASEALRAQTFARLVMERKTRLPWYRNSLFALAAAVLFLVFFWLRSFNSSPSEVLSPETALTTTQGTEANLDPKETVLLAKVMSSELKEMIHYEEKEWDLDLEKETDLLAEDYLEDVIFATLED